MHPATRAAFFDELGTIPGFEKDAGPLGDAYDHAGRVLNLHGESALEKLRSHPKLKKLVPKGQFHELAHGAAKALSEIRPHT
jgi:hypothetical protein